MDIAYSIDFRDIIDSEKAYELFWKGKILNKQNFECPDENCTAQVTCANIDKLEHNMKQSVHYRVIGIHSENCNYETKNMLSTYSSVLGNSNTNRYKNMSDNFHLSRPPNYYDKKESNQTKSNFSKKEHKKNLNYSQKNINSTPRNYYSIRPLVTKYLNTKNHNSCFVLIKETRINYEKIFSEISKTDFNSISDPQIYFGKACIIILENKDILIKFETGFLENEEAQYPPSFFISYKTIEDEKNLYWKEKISTIANSQKNDSIFFIYGKPTKNGKYINFNISNLDFLETRNTLP